MSYKCIGIAHFYTVHYMTNVKMCLYNKNIFNLYKISLHYLSIFFALNLVQSLQVFRLWLINICKIIYRGLAVPCDNAMCEMWEDIQKWKVQPLSVHSITHPPPTPLRAKYQYILSLPPRGSGHQSLLLNIRSTGRHLLLVSTVGRKLKQIVLLFEILCLYK